LKKIAVITGIDGQTGSYMAELLLEKDYEVFGLVRRKVKNTFENIESIIDDVELIEGDLTDQTSLTKLIHASKPDELYNFGAISFVPTSLQQPEYTFDVNTLGVLRLLEILRYYQPNCRFYQASTSEIFGNTDESPQHENTKKLPNTPYSISKLAAHNFVQYFRKSYGMFACSGIAFNHESPRRGEEFVTQKIVKHSVDIYQHKRYKLELGNTSSKRDWGYAKDYVEAMWKMLQAYDPDDYVIGTGVNYSVLDFVKYTFAELNIDIDVHLEHDPKFLRLDDTQEILADPRKIKDELGWESKTDLLGLIKIMISSEFEKRKLCQKV